MASIPPVVRRMIVCDDIERANGVRSRLNVLGLTHSIRAKPGRPFPLSHPGLCVYPNLTGGVGTARIQVRLTEADSGTDLFGSAVHEITHPAARHEIVVVIVRIGRCVFPRPGLYWVEFHHDGLVIRREPITVR